MAERKARRAVIAAARAMSTLGLGQGTAGNVSLRTEGGFLITPSAMAYAEIEEEDIVFMTLKGEPAGRRKPSSEWHFHRAVYAARAEAGAIVHTHSSFATSLSCLRRGIPPFHYMVAVAGGSDIRCADYATFGTPALARAALEALAGRRACLLANHGVLALGADLDAALALALEVEVLARGYLQALAVGAPVLLDEAEMARVVEKFAAYRQP